MSATTIEDFICNTKGMLTIWLQFRGDRSLVMNVFKHFHYVSHQEELPEDFTRFVNQFCDFFDQVLEIDVFKVEET